MVVSNTVHWLLRHGCFLVALAGFIILVVGIARASAAEVFAGGAGGVVRFALRPGRVATVLVIIGGLSAALIADAAVELIVVRDAPASASGVAHEWCLGSYDHVTPPHVDHEPNRVWIVNDSSRSLRFEPVTYGRATPEPPIAIPAGTGIPVSGVDYIGPDDLPPDEVAGVVSETRGWLTWDR